VRTASEWPEDGLTLESVSTGEGDELPKAAATVAFVAEVEDHRWRGIWLGCWRRSGGERIDLGEHGRFDAAMPTFLVVEHAAFS
jgi:hypothetical protein